MTVYDLIQLLEDMPEGAEVRLAHQPSYPLQSHLADDVALVDDLGDIDHPIVYLAEADQVYDSPYLPGVAREQLGWS